MLRFPPKNILVPIDLSPSSYKVFAYAKELARRFAAELEVVYVEPPPPLDFGVGWPIDPPNYKKSLTRDIRLRIGAGPRLTIPWGDPATAILRLALKRRPDLIVMGTHGLTGLRRLVLGSVAEAVIRRSPVPVLAVRDRPRPIAEVVAALNFTDYSDFGLIYAAAFAKGMGARLVLYHATQRSEWAFRVQEELKDRVRRLSMGNAIEPRIVAKPGLLPGSIAAQSKPGSVLVVVSHLKNTLQEAMLGTTAERVLRSAKGSVLVVPAPRQPRAFRPPLEEAAGASRR